jgi:hypothetical protein
LKKENQMKKVFSISAFSISMALTLLLLTFDVSAQKPKVKVTANSVVLGWTQSTIPIGDTCPSGSGSTAITGNNIYRATTPGGEGSTPYVQLTSPSTSYTDTAVVSGTTYYYKVTGINCDGESAQSPESNPALIPNPQVPNAPGQPSVTVQ